MIKRKIRSYYFFAIVLLFVSANSLLAQNTSKQKIAVFVPLYLDSAFDAYNTYRYDKNFPKFINPGLEFYEGEMKTENKVTGSYSLLGDTAISFTCKKNNGKQLIKMLGNINKTKNFVDGSWESNDNHSGSFYLQKLK